MGNQGLLCGGTGLMLAAAMLAGFALPAAAAAPVWPAKPIRFIVPFAPGGSTDTLARTISVKLTESLGQQVVVDNRPGANGNIGMEIVARASPDGYTIVLGYISNLGTGPSLYAKLPYDPVRDYAAVTQLASAPNIVVVHPSVPAKSFKELMAYAKANPEKVSYATAGIGSIGHLSGVLLDQIAGTRMVHVPYKGSGQAVNDILGGHVQMMVSGMSSTIQHVKAGRLRPLAMTSLVRSPAAPDVPTIAESGFPGFEGTAWYGVLAPAGTPPAVVNRLNADILKALKQPDVRDRLAAVGFDIVGSSPAEFSAYIKAEIAKWAKVVKAAGIKPE